MRVVDILYGLPYILFVILLKVVLEQPLTALFGGRAAAANIVLLFVAIGSVSWLTMARVVRGQVLSLKSRPFVEAARAEGLGSLAILRRHLIPNLVGPITVCASLISVLTTAGACGPGASSVEIPGISSEAVCNTRVLGATSVDCRNSVKQCRTGTSSSYAVKAAANYWRIH